MGSLWGYRSHVPFLYGKEIYICHEHIGPWVSLQVFKLKRLEGNQLPKLKVTKVLNVILQKHLFIFYW